MAALSVLMCAEGTYPHYEGGVSVWCDQLVRSLPEFNFRLFSITQGPNQPLAFRLPPNVVGTDAVPIWGTQEPGRQEVSFSESYQRKARTSAAVIRTEFLPSFCELVRCITDTSLPPQRLGNAVVKLHFYFKRLDYVKSMTSPEAWDAFLEIYRECSVAGEKLTVHDATTCMRWIQRFLGVLTVPLSRVDISHSSMAGMASIPGVLSKLLYGSPFLLSEHGIYLRELYLSIMRSGYSEACRRFLFSFNEAVVKMNYHFADVVTALGTFNKSWQVRLGASETKIRLTPNGVDPTRFRPAERAENSRPVVLTMARIYRIKGIEFLLRAAAIVRSRVPSVLFRVLGEPADKAYYQHCRQIVSEHGLENTVEFGSTKDPAPAYAQADVFCLPSISEGMPFSVLEAMFSGCAVVATDVGNVSEMLSGTGIVVRPADSESLARALLSLLEGEEQAREYRRSLASAALKRAHALYTSDQAVSRFRDLYHSLTHDRTPFEVHSAAVR